MPGIKLTDFVINFNENNNSFQIEYKPVFDIKLILIQFICNLGSNPGRAREYALALVNEIN